MRKHPEATTGIGVLGLFAGAASIREDVLSALNVIDMWNLPAWASWLLIVGGTALIIYGYWGRRQEAQGLDREWSEEAAIEMLRVRLEHRRESLEDYLLGLVIVAVSAVLLVGVSRCDGINSPTERYLECVKHSQARDENPTPCKLILGDSRSSRVGD